MLTATQSKALDTVMASYVIPDPVDVRAFLEERPRAAEVLVEALDVIPRYFGSGPDVVLNMSYDAEGVESPFVVASVRSTLPSAARRDAMNRLDIDWYLAYPWELREQVLITYYPV